VRRLGRRPRTSDNSLRAPQQESMKALCQP
jgi:hypothetical protein